jgi:hypothetical protein
MMMIYVFFFGPGGFAVYGVVLSRLVSAIASSNSARRMDSCLFVYTLCCPV